MELESGVFGNNQDMRSARGADPTTARTPLATRLSRLLGLSRYNRGSRAVRGGYAYAARYALVIPVLIALGTRVRSTCSRPYGLRTPYRAVTLPPPIAKHSRSTGREKPPRP